MKTWQEQIKTELKMQKYQRLEYKIYRDKTGYWIAHNELFDLFVYSRHLDKLDEEINAHDYHLFDEFCQKDDDLTESAQKLRDYLFTKL